MNARTRVPRWAPPLLQSFRLAARPAIAYFLFCLLGTMIFMGTILWYERSARKDAFEIVLACTAGMVGIVLGQFVAILRARALPVFAVGIGMVVFAIWLMANARGLLPKEIIPAIVFFCFAFPCGMLSLQHRWELFASFWPGVGFIGGVFVILNEEGRVHVWEKEKIAAWMPVPLVYLALFLVCWLFYLASKQSMRLELWQSLSGAVARRVSKKAEVSAVPRRNILPLFAAAAILFIVVAALAPYLWRTGKGDRKSKDGKPDSGQVEDDRGSRSRRGPSLDGEGLVQQMKKMAQAAKQAGAKLWPLLFLLLLYRPVKRGLLQTHLLTPIVPTPPTERIENLWEYIRIAAEDAGVVPLPSDSVEQLLTRIRATGRGGEALEKAAAIYARTRYGFIVERGDANAMRLHAQWAAADLRLSVTPWGWVKNLFRPLS